jgi:hypothetical protein
MRALILALLTIVALAIVDLFSQAPEGAMGRSDRYLDAGIPVAMTGCNGYTLASGAVDAAGHEAQDGYFNVGKFSIRVPKDSTAAMTLRGALTQKVRIVLLSGEREEINR